MACTDFFQFFSLLWLFVCLFFFLFFIIVVVVVVVVVRHTHVRCQAYTVYIRTYGSILVGLCCRWQRSPYTVKILKRCRCVAEIISETVTVIGALHAFLPKNTDLSPSIVCRFSSSDRLPPPSVGDFVFLSAKLKLIEWRSQCIPTMQTMRVDRPTDRQSVS